MPEKKSLDLLRSALFVPGNRPERIEKALATSADMVIVDLEDAVPLSEKQKSRRIVKDKIKNRLDRPVMVRVNSLETGMTGDDLAVTIESEPDAVMLPKVQSTEDVVEIDRMIRELENRSGLECGAIGLVSLVETALGVEMAFEIASTVPTTKRPHVLAFGAADFTLDMGIGLSTDGAELAYPRARIAIACRAAGLAPPLDTPFMTNLKDTEALKKDIFRAKQFGFGGKLCVHPIQVDICNELFSPSLEEISFSRKVANAFEAASEQGIGVIQVEGKMVDLPIINRSYRVLDIAVKIGICSES